jgi:hypothetical protein
MVKKLYISQIIVYYDIPEIFVAKDEVGTSFLCLLISVNLDIAKYISTPISIGRLSEFITGKIDLREIFLNPESNQFYSFNDIEESIEASLELYDKLPEEYLPDAGFVYKKPLEDNKLILNEALEKNNAIIQIALSDNNDSYSINIDDLGDIVKLYQVIITNSYKKEITKLKVKNKKTYYIPQNYKLRAFASSPSSFNIHLFSTSQVDLFGRAIIELALNKFDEITQDFDDEDKYIESLRSVKGHTIGSLKKLVKKLIDDGIKIKHKWYSPGQDKVHFTLIDKDKAEKIYKILNLSEELAEETKILEGHFVQVDIDNGTWRVFNNEDEKEYNGEATEQLLKGIIVETAGYKLNCQELIEELKVAEKEKIRYILRTIEKIE